MAVSFVNAAELLAVLEALEALAVLEAEVACELDAGAELLELGAGADEHPTATISAIAQTDADTIDTSTRLNPMTSPFPCG